MLRIPGLLLVGLLAGCATKPAAKRAQIGEIEVAPGITARTPEVTGLIEELVESGKLEQAEFFTLKALDADPENPALNYYKKLVQDAIAAQAEERPRHIYPLRKPPQPRLQPL